MSQNLMGFRDVNRLPPHVVRLRGTLFLRKTASFSGVDCIGDISAPVIS